MTNKIEQKIMNPKIIAEIRFMLWVAIFWLAVDVTLIAVAPKEVYTDPNGLLNIKTPMGKLNILVMLAPLALLAIDFKQEKAKADRKSNKFASGAIKTYVKSIIKADPELQKYAHVLSDSNVTKKIADLISQKLRPSEQQDIINVITNLENQQGITKQSVVIAYQEIAQIIKNHAQFDPNFVSEIEIALVHADYLDYVKQAQEKNTAMLQQTAKQQKIRK